MPVPFLRSLRGRLLLLFAALAVGPLLTVGVFDYVRSRRLVENLIATQTDTIARRAAAALDDRYGVIASDILLFSENANLQHFLHAVALGRSTDLRRTRDSAEAFLRSAWKVDSASYFAIELRDTAGGMIFSLRNEPQPGYQPRSVLVTAPLSDLITGRHMGTLLLETRIDALMPADVLGLAFGRSGNTVVIDRARDRILLHSNAAMQGRGTQDVFGAAWPAIDARLGEASGQLTYDDRGSTRIGSFASLRSPPWTVISSTALGEFADSFNRTREIDLGFLLAVAGLVAAAFTVLIGRATRSLEELTHAAARVADGDLSPVLLPYSYWKNGERFMASSKRKFSRQPALRARAACYDPDAERVMIDLAGGVLFGIPLAHLCEIRSAVAADLKRVELLGAGTILHWESLDADYSVPALILSAIGPARAAREFARLGGTVRTDAKAAAARLNGRKGGRPRKAQR